MFGRATSVRARKNTIDVAASTVVGPPVSQSEKSGAEPSAIAAALARLDAHINWERRDRSSGWRVDLAPMQDLMARLGRPDRSFRVVHVAGSKGKGSVSSLLASGLGEGGHRVGVFASPHVERVHERIRIGASWIDDAALEVALTAVLDAADAAATEGSPGGEASWFDLVTAAAFVAFRNAGLEWAVVEVGLGGRLDSTNVIDPPEVAVVTSIALEHTAILGDTHALIAREKGGIIKAGSCLVTGCAEASEAGRVLAELAAERAVPSSCAYDPIDATFEARNLRTARAALDVLGGRGVRSVSGERSCGADWLTPERVRAARLPGRMERRRFQGVDVILDGAHVAESIELALAQGRATCGSSPVVVVAIHREKSPELLLAPLVQGVAHVVATTLAASGVHRPTEELVAACRALGLSVTAVPEPLEALRVAARRAGPSDAQKGPEEGDGWVFVTGSLYLVGAVRGALDPP